VIQKRRWTVLSIFFVLFTIVLIATLKQKPVYRARALVEIQKENPDVASLQELFQLESVSDTFLETQYKVLESENLARRVTEQLRLDQIQEFNPPPSWWSSRKKEKDSASRTFAVGGAVEKLDSELEQDILKRFQERLSIDPVKRSRLVAISFESNDAKLAARIVNTLASNYIEQSLEARWEATQKATEWLSQQLGGLKARLEKSEDELHRYARANRLVFLERESGNPENILNERLKQLQEELTRAQADRYQKESLYRLVQAGDYGALPGVFNDKLIQDLTVRLAELQREQAELLATFSADYPRVKQLQSQIDQLQEVLRHERERAARWITNEYTAAMRREELVRDALAREQKQGEVIAEKSVQYNILKREVETNRQLYEGLLQRLKEAGVSASLKASNVRILDSAVPPNKPVKPRVLLNLSLALILGLALGVGAAFMQEHLDNTLKSTEDVERFLHMPALALIPSVESLNGHPRRVYGLYERGLALTMGKNSPKRATRPAWHRIDEIPEQHSALAEAFRSLRTSVLLSTANRPPKSLLVTSAQPADGKTTVAANLAISMAQLGQRVLLIDGDLRRPSVHRIFGIDPGPGLVSYLAGHHEWGELVHKSGLGKLDLFPCGPLPPNPAELLSSDRMRMFVQGAGANYDLVIIDSPPLLNVADSRVLASMVEGVLLVVKGGHTPRELVRRAQFYAREVGASLIGVVLNDVDVRSHDYYYYQSYYSRSEEGSSDETAAPD
jgi:exopolysaccharide transport family protein